MSNIDKPIAAFVITILGIVFVGIIAGIINTGTSTSFANNETVSISSARLVLGTINESKVITLANPVTGWRSDDLSDCAISNFVLKNQTGSTMTATTHYVLNANAGTLTLKNVLPLNTSASNTTTVNYNYCGNDYLSNDMGRSSLRFITGFLALFILIGVISIVYVLINKTKKD